MDDEAVTHEVEALMREFIDAYAERDPERIIALFSTADDVTFLGIGAEEWRVGPEQVRVQVEGDLAGDAQLEVDTFRSSISRTGEVAWTAGEAEVIAEFEGEKFEFLMRVTMVLRCEQGKYRIAMMHTSLPES